MTYSNLDNFQLLELLALVFPEGSIADFGRRLSHECETAFKDGAQSGKYLRADRPQITGQLRWANTNRMFSDYAEENGWEAKPIKMGEGCDNHVKVFAKCFCITCHHVPVGQSRPAPAKYVDQAHEINSLLSQSLLNFEGSSSIQAPFSSRSIYLQILYSTNPENGAEVEDIDFVFAAKSGVIAKFSITDVIKGQSELNALPESELNIIKRKFEDFGFGGSA